MKNHICTTNQNLNVKGKHIAHMVLYSNSVLSIVMIVKQTFGLVSKGFTLQKSRATYTSQNGVFTERVR